MTARHAEADDRRFARAHAPGRAGGRRVVPINGPACCLFAKRRAPATLQDKRKRKYAPASGDVWLPYMRRCGCSGAVLQRLEARFKAPRVAVQRGDDRLQLANLCVDGVHDAQERRE